MKILVEVIFTDRNRHLVLQRRGTFTPSFTALLERTLWGSGGVQYYLPGMAETLNGLKEPHFLSLTKDGQLVAVSTLIPKYISLGGEVCPAFYLYALTVDAPSRGRGYGALLVEQALRYSLDQMGQKGIFYGYVETGNTRSLKTVRRVGLESLGQFHSLVFSRWRPQAEARLAKIEATQRETLVHALNQQYAEHALLDLDQSVKIQDYYLLTEREEIVAGVQCGRPRAMTISHLPGAGGLLLVKVLPYIPFLRDLFPDRSYRFLKFGNLFAKRGRESAIFTLMEALLARHQLNFGMICLDQRSPVYQRLAAAGKFGLFNALVDVPVQVMAYFQGFAETEIAAIREQPLLISMLDQV